MMNTFICILISFVASIHVVRGQCGCQPQNLLKRDLKGMKLGDMLLDKNSIAVINGFKNHYSNTPRWPNNQVLYTFAPTFPGDKVAVVKQSFSELQKDLGNCIRFRESTQSHYILIDSKPNKGCFSSLGYTRGPSQLLQLQNPKCLNSKGTIKHEILHALGFIHTHMRQDRDKYIDIKWSRISSSTCSQFVKCNGCEPDGPYETTSVMHYGSEAYACVPGEKVVMKKDGTAITYNHNTTPNDLQMIKNFYQCR